MNRKDSFISSLPLPPQGYCESVSWLVYHFPCNLAYTDFFRSLLLTVCLYTDSITLNRQLDHNAESQAPILELLNQDLHLTRSPGDSYGR